MSRKNRIRQVGTPDSGTGEPGSLRSAPDPTSEPRTSARTTAEDKLWKALHDNPGTTTSELSSAAAIGKSTAPKILVRWAGDGSVTRTSGVVGGGRRAADRWSVTGTLADVGTELEEAIGPRDSSPATATSEVATPAEFADAPDGATTVDGRPETAEVNGDPDGDAVAKAARLAPGALRGLVEDYLRDHPADQFSPSKIGKALDRSAGAVNNALEKLVRTGYAVQTNDAPKRFAIATAGDDAAPAAAVE